MSRRSDSKLDADDIWDLLDQMVVKGLVVRDADRFRLSESVRAFALEQVAPDEGQQLREAHFQYFAKLGFDTERKVRGPDQKKWLLAYEEESENLRAALDFSFRTPLLGRAGLELLYDLTTYFFIRGLFAESLRWYEVAVRLTTDDEPDLKSRIFRRAGMIATYRGDPQAGPWLAEALKQAQRTEDKQTLADALYSYGNFLHMNERVDEAKPFFQECLAEFERLGDRAGQGFAAGRLGATAVMSGDFDAANRYYQQSLEVRTESGDARGIAVSLALLAGIALRRGDFLEAKELIKKSLTLLAELGAEVDFAGSSPRAAWIAAELGRCDIAAKLLGFSDCTTQDHNAQREPCDVADYWKALESIHERSPDTDFNENWRLGSTLTMHEALTLALEVL